jgi:AraC family transcriptional regulator
MQRYSDGKYLGANTYETRINGLIISENKYQAGFSSQWHYHENPYFAFILKGGSLEKRKTGDVACSPGMLLFYNTQEIHKNEQYKEGSKNFSIEFEREWFGCMDLNADTLEGGFVVENFEIKKLIIQMMGEVPYKTSELQVSFESALVGILSSLSGDNVVCKKAPTWLIQLKEMLHDMPLHPFSLTELSRIFGVHPVTISRLFPHFFGSTIGEYIRELKIEHSFPMLAKKHISLHEVATSCGFADHPHFTRAFRKSRGMTPSQYRSLLLG